MNHFHSLTIKEIRRETTDAVSVVFDIPETLQSNFRYKEGQYLTLKLNINGEEIRRSYSICSSPYDNSDLRIAIKEVDGGRASTMINRHLKIGDTLEVMPPMGNFNSVLDQNNNKHYVLFAGGSGITPMMSILKSILIVEKQSKITLIYANRHEDSVIFKTELENIEMDNSTKVNLVSIYDNPKNDVPNINKGLITLDRAKQIINNYSLALADEYFICGPNVLMQNIEAALSESNVHQDKVHIEYFTALVSNLEIPTATTNLSGHNITVIFDGDHSNFDYKSGVTVLEAAIEADLDVPFSCKGGVCCACRAKLIEGEVAMLSSQALSKKEISQGYILTCQSHATTEKLVVDYDA